jgi:hypothetical protein
VAPRWSRGALVMNAVRARAENRKEKERRFNEALDRPQPKVEQFQKL